MDVVLQILFNFVLLLSIFTISLLSLQGLFLFPSTCFFFYYSLHSILLYISFGCTTEWLDDHILYKVSPRYFQYPLAPYIIITYYWLYCLCCTSHPCDCLVTTNESFLISSPVPPVLQPSSPPATTSLSSVSVSLFQFTRVILNLSFLLVKSHPD